MGGNKKNNGKNTLKKILLSIAWFVFGSVILGALRYYDIMLGFVPAALLMLGLLYVFFRIWKKEETTKKAEKEVNESEKQIISQKKEEELEIEKIDKAFDELGKEREEAAKVVKEIAIKWTEFKNKENTDDILIDKASKLAASIIYLADKAPNRINQAMQDFKKTTVKEEKIKKIIFEFIVFYMHIADRESYAILGKEKRNLFMDTLVENVALNFTEYKEELRKLYNERQLEYALYRRYFPEKDEGTGGTLFWEFSKIVAEETGVPMEVPIDIKVIIIVTNIAVDFLGLLNIRKLLLGK